MLNNVLYLFLTKSVQYCWGAPLPSMSLFTLEGYFRKRTSATTGGKNAEEERMHQNETRNVMRMFSLSVF